MAFASLTKQRLLLQRYIDSLSDEEFVSQDDENLETVSVDVRATQGPFKYYVATIKFHLSVEAEKFCFKTYVRSHFPHPNFNRVSDSTSYSSKHGCVQTPAGVLAHLLHVFNHPDFSDTCNGLNYSSQEDVDRFLRQFPPTEEDDDKSEELTYPFYEDKKVRAESFFFPSSEHFIYASADVTPRSVCRPDLLPSPTKAWLSSVHFQSLLVSSSHGQPHEEIYYFMERGVVQSLASFQLSKVAQNSHSWDPGRNVSPEHFSFMDTRLLAYRYEQNVLGYCGYETNQLYEKSYDFLGKKMDYIPNHENDYFTNEILARDRLALEFDSRVIYELHRPEYEAKRRSNWPFAIAPGRCIPYLSQSLMEFKKSMADWRRGSTYSLFMQIFKEVEKYQNVHLVLFDKKALTIFDPLICRLVVTSDRYLIGLQWSSLWNSLRYPLVTKHELGWSGLITTITSGLVGLLHNYFALLHRVELYGQLGYSRVKEDILRTDGTVAIDLVGYFLSPANSFPAFDGYPLLMISRLLRATCLKIPQLFFKQPKYEKCVPLMTFTSMDEI